MCNYKISSILLYIFIMLSNGSCINSDAFEKHTSFYHSKWKSTDTASFSFHITDTGSQYLMYAMIRHTDAYPFSNIWIHMRLLRPDKKEMTNTRIEIPLADNYGKWLGRGMSELWEHKMPMHNENTAIKFPVPGLYKMYIAQIMRSNPLPEMMSFGIRLEKQTKKIQ